MCLAYPARVVSLPDPGTADTVVAGRPQRVPLVALEQASDLRIGEWLLVQSGLAVCRLSPAEARDRLRLLDDLQGGSREP
jgi:hydrogenase maturation factor